MSVSAFLCIKYSKEMEDKIKKIPGIVPSGARFLVQEDLFPQHKKESGAHRWVVKNDKRLHYPQNDGKWEYLSHGFEIYIPYEGKIMFVVPCHWVEDHGVITLLDLKKWISDNLGVVDIISERVS